MTKANTMALHQTISQMLWMNHEAEEAANFYASTFPGCLVGRIIHYTKEGQEITGMKEGSVMSVELDIDGYTITLLNGGPVFKINPSISLFITYESEKDIDAIWQKLSDGGVALMPLDKYPWSEKYGWIQDRYGTSWQVSLGNRNMVGNQSVVPCMMFVNQQCGNAEAAMKFYVSVFSNSKIEGTMRYEANETPDKEGTVKHAQFTLNGQTFMIMDSAHKHDFNFNEGISNIVQCKNQQEVDYYWEKLSEGGDPKAQVCGWLKDKYGVSWQIVPDVLNEMLMDKDQQKIVRVTQAYLKMKKFDIAALQNAFEGAPPV